MVAFIRVIFRALFRIVFRVKVHGLENFHAAGKRLLVVANHVSLLDGLLLVLFIPGAPMFVINTHWANKKWLKPLLSLGEYLPVDQASSHFLKSVIKEIKKDRHIIIFPEGRLTTTGSIMKIYHGPALIAEKGGANILPVYIKNAEYSKFSRLKCKLNQHWFPKISLHIYPEQVIHYPDGLKGHKRRVYAENALERIMLELSYNGRYEEKTIPHLLIEAREHFGGNTVIAEDLNWEPLTYNKLIIKTLVLSELICNLYPQQRYIGLMLPNTNAALVTFLSLQFNCKVPVMLNFTMGEFGLLNACETANIKTIITSRKFIEIAKLEDLIEKLSESVALIFLEDLKEKVTLGHKMKAVVRSKFPMLMKNCLFYNKTSADQAVVLFTSGSEGLPKGVVLSHNNIATNRSQLASVVDLNTRDIIFNALPMFHSFGLTVGTILPLLNGIKIFFYPSPLHYHVIPEYVYDTDSTIFFGTNTFLNGYAKYAHPLDFHNLRMVLCGAEKLQEETDRVWHQKFGIRINEGYGVTECGPAISANVDRQYKRGTVGKILPGIEYYLEPVEGVEEGGRLVVKGPNIMMGYLYHDNPCEIVPPETDRGNGWYDTGDVVTVDDEGFITIIGRAKRFAKIGGEMVSLATVENLAYHVWPNAQHVATQLPDKTKGEQIVLLTTQRDPDRQDMSKGAKEQGLSELHAVKKIIFQKELPLLGSGKVDYGEVRKVAEAALNS